LDSERGVKTLEDIGLEKDSLTKIRNAIHRPYGMVLITGPTGSGKSTTLYSMLNELDRQKQNVVSLEDPVEYNIDGVSQSNVRPEIGYTFATGLRSILRQDPDIIMVGEIRDKETAQLAVQAALTGHLVFSTLHTNTAAGAIPRLIDMGVDPYLIAPTLILAIAQRLTSALCEGGGKEVPIDEAMQAMIDNEFSTLPEKYREKINIPDHVYEAGSTTDCPSGIRGRQAVFEILEVNEDVRHAILNKPVESEVFQVARKNGMLTMKEDALLKTFEGKIPYIEVNKL
jgi:type II secretory ATPase GspE/PulE/Tfp pilus assembly ATPase PilB-like protein